MNPLWRGIKLILTTMLIMGLLFSSGIFSFLLYNELANNPIHINFLMHPSNTSVVLADATTIPKLLPSPTIKNNSIKATKKILIAPLVKQNPELPNGCEIASLAMLLHYAKIPVNKMDLVKQMKRDPTPIAWNQDGTIKYWGNPNIGFVGNITNKGIGFGIYHTALIDLLQKYIPSGVDLTRKSFDVLENKIADGKPVLVWTTTTYTKPQKWVIWDSPLGPIKTTFSEHAVLLIGYDENYVYVNDPLSEKIKVQINKKQFIASWEALGKQAISY